MQRAGRGAAFTGYCRSVLSFADDGIECVFQLGVRFTAGRTVVPQDGLGLSYRSSPRVLDLIGVVSRHLGGQALESHEPERWFEGGITAGVGFDSSDEEAQFIQQTSDAILARRPSSTIGVICRNGWRRKPIDAEFAASETPCTRWDLAVDDARVV